MDKATIVTRPYAIADRNFIIATWLKGQRWGNHYFNEVPQDLYFREFAQIITRTLALPDIEIVIACDKAKPGWICGFAVLRGGIIYWTHVRSDYRNQGIAKLMLAGREITAIKSLTRIGGAIARKHGLIFNPF